MAQGQVRRRIVFYCPGFDPFPARRYRELYRKEGQLQAQLSGYHLDLQGDPTGWRVTADIEGAQVETRFEVWVWSDLVKSAMPQGILATYGQLLRTGYIYLKSGAVWPLISLRKGPLLAACYPVLMLLGQLALALALGAVAAKALGDLIGPFAWIVAVLVVWGLLRLFKRWDRKIFAHYLLHDFAYVARDWGAYDAALEARLAEFGARLRAGLAEDVDEVLVVGHSSGVHLAISVLADHLRQGAHAGPVLSFLSLGQAVPMVSFLPKAQRLRGDLALMAAQDQIAWVDVTAPSDGCTYALCDPVAVTGVQPEGAQWPLVLSAAFRQTLSAEKLRSMRWRFFRLHFQYLCAFDRLSDDRGVYDYFRTTAGPKTLWQRFGKRKPSGQRITRVASPHRDVE